MADVSGLVNDVLKSLASTAFQEFKRLRSLKDDVSALKETYTQIQAVLSDAEVKQSKEKSVETWLKSLRSASLEVENILDGVIADAMLQRLHNELEKGIEYKVRAFFSSKHNPIIVRFRTAQTVKTIRIKLDKIAEDRSKFKFTSHAISASVGVGGETTNKESSSLVPTSKIYGRDDEVEIVVQKVCSEDIIGDDTQGVRVYAIWGMGGLGKTTLAQLVYNHERVKTRFELQSWVYVSNDFQVNKITKGIIESISKSPWELSQLDAMQVELKNKLLNGKRFFIVLDDVWIEDRDVNKWEEFSKALSSGAKGSIVMVTTRKKTTSMMMAKVPEFQHQLGCLSEDESWLMFKNLAFASGSGRDGENIKELESIGKEIVHKCQGLPLAVKTLGGLMRSKSSASEWQSVKDSDVWELQEDDILPALKLSYDNLLPHMKRCFAYCCLFPKGYKMGKDLLLELWISNGFVPSRGGADLYMIGEEIFNCMVSRCFLQDVQVDEECYYSDLVSDLVCKMHDLMHELARYVMRHECSVIELGKELITPDEVLHFSSTCSNFSFSVQDLERVRSLRSIFVFVDGYECNMISQISMHMYLRVLYLDEIQVSTLPESICKLKHLRYLSISRSQIVSLPESIIYLQNLQVLLVKGCWELRKFPEGMRHMKNLRCLDNRGCPRLDCMPIGVKELSCLRRLGKFVVGKKKGAQIRELGGLNLLGGSLELQGLDNVGGLEEAKSANLKHKTNLIQLTLDYRSGDDNSLLVSEEKGRQHEEVVEGLEPNLTLKELLIYRYQGKMITPSWMMKLGNLVKITFLDFKRCESIPSLGKLPNLRVIELFSMDALKCLDEDEFPSLHELRIIDSPQLTSLPNNLPQLESLFIVGADCLVRLPSNLPKLKKLRMSHCPELHCLPDGLKELNFLEIVSCQNLRRRCEKDKGEEWRKISHVPNILM